MIVDTWRFEDQLGIAAPPDADKRELVAEWLNAFAGMSLEDLTAGELNTLLIEARFCALFSVVKADHDRIDPDDCGGWHSEGSGRRSMPAWFIDADTFYLVVDAVLARAVQQ